MCNKMRMAGMAAGIVLAGAWATAGWCQTNLAIPLDQPGEALICEKANGCPYPVTGRAKIANRQLVVELDTVPAAVTNAEQPYSLLGRTGFAIIIDPFRNYYRYVIVTVDFTGKAVTYGVHQADYFEIIPLNVTNALTVAGDKATVRIGVPLDALGITPGAGDEWGLNVNGYVLDAGGKPLDPGGVHAWSKNTSIPRPQWLARFAVGRDAPGYSLTRGNLAPEEVFALNRFAWTWLKPETSGRGKIMIRSIDDQQREHVELKTAFDYRAGEPAPINVGYACPTNARAMAFEAQDAHGKALYSSRYPVFPNMPNRLASPKNHFNKECLEHVTPDPRLKGDTRIIWHHNVREQVQKGNVWNCAYAFDGADWWRYYKTTGQAMILVDREMQRPFEGSDYVGRAQTSGVAVALMPTGKASLTPKGHDAIFFYADPATRESYLANMRELLNKNGDIIRYIYFGDEFRNSLVRDAIYLWRECRDQYPLIQQVNEEIKTKYGFGKYGIPEKSDYRFQFEYIEPYNWLALRRWASDLTVDFAKQVRDEARKIKPDILMISPDPKCGNQPEQYELWRNLFDVATHQVYLKPVPEEQMFPGFNVKLIRDLSGISHVWLCLHMELGALHSPDEVREILSQVFIAGGDGVHDWPIPQWAAGGPYVNRLSSPMTESMICQFSTLLNSGVRAKQDSGKEVALFYGNDSCAAQGDEYGIPQPPRAYQYLADGCAVNFRFIGDLGIERGDDQAGEYKAMVVPVAQITRRGVTEKILAAVSNGLNLLVLQPDAFAFNLDGTSTAELANALRGGAKLAEHRQAHGGQVTPAPGAELLKDLAIKQLPFVGDDYKYRFTDLTPYKTAYTFTELPKEASVILRYPDGAAAGIEVPVGKGRVCWLGFSPLIVNYSAEWVAFHRAVLGHWGLALDRPVWRLQLPLKFERAGGDRVYLTGNGYTYECSIPQATMNMYLPGSYRYDVAPDVVKDVAGAGTNIPFTTGRLTDRQHPSQNAYVTYTNTAQVSIDFDLLATCPVDGVDVYVGDYAPAMTLLAGDNGKDFSPVTQVAAAGDESGLRQIALACGGKKSNHRYWRLVFGERPAGKKLSVIEVDIWQK